ncbi:MAG: M3 family metallopeptidase [Francisellaceae bacterium]
MNSLLQQSDFPQFSRFKVGECVEAIETVLTRLRQKKDELIALNDYSWKGFVAPFEEAEDALSQAMSPISHLNAVMNNDQLRAAYQTVIELITDYATEMAQDKKLFEIYQTIHDGDASLDEVQKKILSDAIRDFKLAGVDLSQEKQDQYKKIVARLAKLQSDFENNVLDATMNWHYHSVDGSELSGLSEDMLALAATKAKQAKKSGLLLGIDPPSYLAVMQQADNRALRETFYRAYNTRASSLADDKSYDNSAIMNEIMDLRQEKAKILGFDNYAEVSLATKMAHSVDQVETFLWNLVEKSYPQAQQELKELAEFVKTLGVTEPLESWDLAYYSEKLKKQRFDFTEEELKVYFPLSQVMSGLFQILADIYGLTVIEELQFDRYHADTTLYRFEDGDGNLRGKILIDLFARDHKRGGAWMDECRTRFRKRDHSLQIPVAYVNCNFMPTQNGDEPLLKHNEVVTLFHEFGHALHHILTQIDYLPASGINGVEWDAVELPSQFMENFCWQRQGIALISKHVKTGQPLPDALFDKLIQSRVFHSALAMIRQLEFSLFDMLLHKNYDRNRDIHAVLSHIRERVAVIKTPDYNRFENSFAHIFAGGYAAGYYSYKWAEVLSSDAFAMFEESGDILSYETGQRFLHGILEQGGSKSAATLFKAMRGRDPDITALLRHSGILAHESEARR